MCGDRHEAALGIEVVRVSHAPVGVPRRGSAVPCLGQRHHVVDVQLPGLGDRGFVSGRTGRLPGRSPLRTGRATFTASGSSRPLGLRVHYLSWIGMVSSMMLPMAFGMNEYEVGRAV